jgi:integrase
VLAVKSGMRQGEILGLTWDDIDFERGTVSVSKSLQRKDGRFVFETPKSAVSRRLIRLSPSVMAVLQAHRDRQPVVVIGWNLVFATEHGKPLSARNVVRAFKRFLLRHGLREIRFHDLRHSHATLLLLARVPTKAVQERLGHSSVNLTSDVYQHILSSLQDDVAERLDEMLG